MALKGVWVVQVDGVHLLSGVLGSSLDVIPQKLTESAELGLARVFLAEGKCLHGSALVHNLQASIVAEDVENRAICLPQEFQPWCDDCSICAVARLLAGHGGQENRLWGFAGLEIIDTGGCLGSLEGALDLIRLGLGVLNLLFGEFDEFLEDEL